MIEIIFGKPGAGKTTLFASIVQKNKAKKFFGDKIKVKFLNRIYRKIFPYYDTIYCTDPTVSDTITIEYKTVGFWKPAKNSLMLLDEIGIGFNNRNWSKMPEETKRFFAMHRHLFCDVIGCSQTVDCDISIRHRSLRLWQMRKIGSWSVLTPIKFKIGVDNELHEITEIYSTPEKIKVIFAFLFHKYKYIYRPTWYSFFDSFSDDMKYKMKTPE